MFTLATLPAAESGDDRAALSGLVGHSKAEVIQRFGFPSDAQTTLDGERMFYETLDAGQVGGRSWHGTRSGGLADISPYPRIYSFRCSTEIIIRDGYMRAYHRSGNDCH